MEVSLWKYLTSKSWMLTSLFLNAKCFDSSFMATISYVGLIFFLSSSPQQQEKSNTSTRTKVESETKSSILLGLLINIFPTGGNLTCFANNFVALVEAIIEFNLLSLKESGLLVNTASV